MLIEKEHLEINPSSHKKVKLENLHQGNQLNLTTSPLNDVNPLEINETFFQNLEKLKEAWQSNDPINSYSDGNVTIVHDPFKACYMDKFLHDIDENSISTPEAFENKIKPTFSLSKLKEDLLQEPFYHKSNDLYEFYQSEDLKLSNVKSIQTFRDAIYSERFIQFMSALTGIELTIDRIDLSSHRYPPGGHLLCHDDDIGDSEDQENGSEGYCRKIAFILYLVDKDWGKQQDAQGRFIDEGGKLELFSSDELGNPDKVKYSIAPKWNRFAFFELGPCSHHQVQEVLGHRERMSISGWLHGPRMLMPHQYRQVKNKTFNEESPFTLNQWINPLYFSKDAIEKMNKVFLETSSIQLQDFLLPEAFLQLKIYFDSHSTQQIVGPPNAKKYSTYTPQHAVNQKRGHSMNMSIYLSAFQSKEFRDYLQQITGLALHEKPVNCNFREFRSGNYQLLHDQYKEPFGLDVTYFFLKGQENIETKYSEEEINEKWGGWTYYVADSETLLSLQPKSNMLSLVLRDEGTFRFVKYLNHQSPLARREMDMIWPERNDVV